MTDALRRPPVELSADRSFGGRIRRLAATAVVALGVMTGLAALTLDVPGAVVASLAAGWVLMPLILVGSLGEPRLRYALVVPSSLIGVPLLAICALWLPSQPAAAAGWLLVTGGILLGSGLGLWFWYRILPVPRALDDPFAPGRWALIGVHVGLIVLGLALASVGLGA